MISGPIARDLSAVADRLRDEADAVINPDHPLLLSGPDALFATDGHLVAVIVASLGEARHPLEFELRAAWTRLALPRHTVIVVAKRTELTVPQQLEERVADIPAELDQLSWDPRVIRDALGSSNIPSRQTPLGVRAAVDQRFSRILSAASRKLVPRSVANTRQLDALWQVRRDFPLAVGPEDIVPIGRESTRPGHPTSWRRLLRAQLVEKGQRDFRFDNGVAYLREPTRPLSIRAIDLQTVPRGASNDPAKPLRASAFAGIEFPTASYGLMFGTDG